MPRLVNISLLWLAALAAPVFAHDTVKFRDGDIVRTVTGRVMAEAQNGMLLCGDDGQIWGIRAENLLERDSNDQPLVPVSDDEMEKRLLDEFGEGFSVFRTLHYVVVYDSSEAYARQVAAMYEQLYRGFFTFWKNQYWKLPDPEFPLVAVVLRDRDSFLSYAEKEVGEAAKNMLGYYNLANNRILTFNIPNLERNVSTIIHEATHQLSFNCGLQARYADNPKWVSEGLATFFETPDRRNPTRWRDIGRINQVNLARWRKYQRNRTPQSLATLVADDTRFNQADSITYAYGEAWAFTYFLIKTKRKEYVKFLQTLSNGRPGAKRSQKERIQLVETAFEMSLEELDQEFLRYMSRLRG
ncbi:MAG: DUF1570 domain-containing protein [Planctomycetota bacterium]